MRSKLDLLTPLELTIARITQMIADMEAEVFSQDGFSDLSMRQVLYMETIARLGHPSFSDLANALEITRPSVTASVAKLIRSGYVQKVQDGDDRRSFHIVLTARGRKFTQIHKNMHRKVVEALIARLSGAEISQLAVLLNKSLNH